MRFPYHQIEDDTIESLGNIQSNEASPRLEAVEDEPFLPPKPLLLSWPSWIGYCQIAFGFLCAIFGSIQVFVVPVLISLDAEIVLFGSIQVFVVPVLISLDAEIGLYRFNWYGAAIWIGVMMILSGSCAVRASKKRDMHSVIQFYVVSGLSFLCSLAFIILIHWCDLEISDPSKCNEAYPIPEPDCDFKKIHKYAVLSVLSAVFCQLGCLLLFLSTVNYFCPVMFGEVHLLKKLGVCWLPCCFYLPPQDVLIRVRAQESSDDSSLNVIV